MPLPQKGLAPILIAPPNTYLAYATQARLVLLNKAKPMLHHVYTGREQHDKIL